MATLVLLGMRRVMSIPDLFILGLVRNMKVGAWPVNMVSIGVGECS